MNASEYLVVNQCMPRVLGESMAIQNPFDVITPNCRLDPYCFNWIKCVYVCVVGMYPTDQSEYPSLRSAVEKLTLNDSSVMVQKDSSLALGAGWRSGFKVFTFPCFQYCFVAEML